MSVALREHCCQLSSPPRSTLVLHRCRWLWRRSQTTERRHQQLASLFEEASGAILVARLSRLLVARSVLVDIAKRSFILDLRYYLLETVELLVQLLLLLLVEGFDFGQKLTIAQRSEPSSERLGQCLILCPTSFAGEQSSPLLIVECMRNRARARAYCSAKAILQSLLLCLVDSALRRD